MTIHWSLFVPGVLLLLFPADRLLSAAVRLRSFESFNTLEDSPESRPWWWVPALWLDPLRAFAGMLLLKRSLPLDPEAPALAYVLTITIVVTAVLCQTFTRREAQALLAPVGFVAGLVAALVPWPVALIGLVMATAGLFAFRQFHAFFSIGCAMIAVVGVLLDASILWLAPAAGVLVLPIVTGFLTGNSLELPTYRPADRLRGTRAPA